jgi:signal transduction histidine kinase
MKTMKVLLVDDKSENLLALESLLKADAVEFHRATSGVEALELLLVQEYALAILDVQMPEMDGFELAELMRGTQQTRSVPIIFVTAGTRDQMNTFRGYDKGAVDFMYKPLDPHVVRSKVQVFLELARQRQLLQQQLTQTQQALKERDQALRSAHEALHTRDEFMSIASHELKTPLTSLHLQIQMMSRTLMRAFDGTKDDSLPISRLMQGLEVCERQSGKLSSLLDELLDLTRVRLGKLNLAYSEVNLSDLVQELVNRFRLESAKKGLEIRFVKPELPIFGTWDPTRIEQIVSNLISNAIKYGDSKPVSLDLSLGGSPQGTFARLTVRDEGIGIAEDMQEKIFERFERAITSQKISGLGLGLYITRQITEAHGGTIRVNSSLGKGSEFVVELPLKAQVTTQTSA